MSDNEQKDERRETLADIVAEKRARANEIEGAAGCDSNQFQRELIRDLRAEADRIEAAWKREREDLELRVTRMTREECMAEYRKYVGNAAAMRDALLNIQEYAAAMDVDDGNVLAILDACRDALAAPARNCDLYDNWYDAHQAWERLPKDELGYFVDENGVHKCEQAWLFAPGAERKGEGDAM